MRLYLDANAIVFVVEGPDELRATVTAWLDKAENSPDGAVVTSRLSFTECYTQSLRERNTAAFQALERFFNTSGVEILSIDDDLVDIATDLQKDFSLKTIDALHVATAIRSKSDVFLTRDGGISRHASIRGVQIEHIASARPQAPAGAVGE